jgi:hypothetical protein
MNSSDRISIERECARLISQYAYLNDERNFELLANLFTEDAVLYRPATPQQAVLGRAAILEAFKKRPAEVATFHVCSDVIVDVESESAASARSRILLMSGARTEGSMVPTDIKPAVPGTFRDRFQLTEDGWKFKERRGGFWI